jgi:DNA-binding FrmR family transcriptional regulator
MSAITDTGTPPPSVSTPPGYTDHKNDHLARLHKIEGQVRGVTRMVDDDRYCIDIITQIGAITRALQAVALGLLDEHMRHCVRQAVESEPLAGEAKFDEVSAALRRTLHL